MSAAVRYTVEWIRFGNRILGACQDELLYYNGQEGQEVNTTLSQCQRSRADRNRATVFILFASDNAAPEDSV